MNLVRSITTVGGYTIGSRLFGFVREILTASLLGAGPQQMLWSLRLNFLPSFVVCLQKEPLTPHLCPYLRDS